MSLTRDRLRRAISLLPSFLYRDLTFGSAEEIRVKTLLMTVLDRPELAKLVRSFKLSQDRRLPGPANANYQALQTMAVRLWTYDKAIKSAVRAVPLPTFAAMNVFGSIFTRVGTVAHPQPSLDGTIALLLCLATNVESIQLAMEGPAYLDITRQVLNGLWTTVQDTEKLPQPLPLGTLKTLHFHGSRLDNDISMALSVNGVTEKLVLKCLCISTVGNVTGSPDALRTLELRGVESLIHTCTFPNLTSLVLDNLGASKNRAWSAYDFSRLSALLIKHTPLLEQLACTRLDHGFESPPRPFASLTQLSKLRTLRVDMRVLLGHALANEDTILPQSLKHFTLVMSHPKRVDALFADTEHSVPRALLTDPAQEIALKRFTVVVRMHVDKVERGKARLERFRDWTLEMWKTLVERAGERGIKYRVYGWVLGDEEPRKYLLGPWFESKRPDFADYRVGGR